MTTVVRGSRGTTQRGNRHCTRPKSWRDTRALEAAQGVLLLEASPLRSPGCGKPGISKIRGVSNQDPRPGSAQHPRRGCICGEPPEAVAGVATTTTATTSAATTRLRLDKFSEWLRICLCAIYTVHRATLQGKSLSDKGIVDLFLATVAAFVEHPPDQSDPSKGNWPFVSFHETNSGLLQTPDRKRPLDYNDDASGDDANTSLLSSSSKKQKTDGALLACPFFKFDPFRHMDCLLRNRLRSTNYVRQHVLRGHKQPRHCVVCGEIFRADAALHSHLRERSCQPQDFQVDGITPAQIELISQLSDRKLGETERWFQIWTILFPNAERPQSPYIADEVSEILLCVRQYYEANGGLDEIIANLTAPDFGLRPDLMEHARRMAMTVLQHFIGFGSTALGGSDRATQVSNFLGDNFVLDSGRDAQTSVHAGIWADTVNHHMGDMASALPLGFAFTLGADDPSLSRAPEDLVEPDMSQFSP